MTGVADPARELPQLDAVRRLGRKLPTPSLIVHADIARRNVERYADMTQRLGIDLRPHAKSHKSDVLAGWQRDSGSVGLTVGTFEEAEFFLAAGYRDLFVACPPVGATREEAMATLARDAEPIVSVDSLETVAVIDSVGRSIGQDIRYYWEVDTGFGRYGTAPGAATVSDVLAAQRFRYAAFAGLMSFSGGAYLVEHVQDVSQVSRAEAEQTVDTADLIRSSGVDVPTVSVGSTPSATAAASVPGVTELRIGTYIFNDATQVALGAAELADCAQTICTTVMSTPADGRIVIDAGSKALPKESMSRLTTGFGIVLEYPGLVIERVSEEASVLTWAGRDHVDPPKVGEQLQVVSNHCCSATYLFSHFWLIGDGTFDRLAIHARTR
jgi:D-serine deaminase-like pyridoxal phosphate-dependent protein